MTTADITVIGGGLVGCSATLHACRRGAATVLLERGLCGGQASGVNYGGVRQQGRDLAELPLARRSRAIWATLPELIGADGEFSVTGHLKLARTDTQMADLEDHAAKVRDHGLTVELMGRNRLRQRYPWLGNTVVGGSFCAEDGQANPRLVAPAFARAARAAGADIREDTEVTGVTHDNGRFEIRTSTDGPIRATTLINAAGAWGSDLAARFGDTVPAGVMAPNMAVTEPLPHVITVNVGVCGGAIYIRQIPRGNVIFGGGEGTADRAAIRAYASPESTIAAARQAVELIPHLATAQIIRTWSGIEARTPDGLPVIGFSSTTPGLIHAFGFSGHGFQMAPAVGAVVAELALDGETATPIEAFSVARFSPGNAAASLGHQLMDGTRVNEG